MEKRIFGKIWICFVALICFGGYAQNKQVKVGDRQFENLAFADAIKSYENAIRQGSVNQEDLKNLADAYYNNGLYDEANKWYSEILDKGQATSDFVDAEVYFRYIQTLKSKGNYREADRIMDLMADKFKEDIRVKMYLANKSYLEFIRSNPSAFSATLMENVNTAFSDYGATMYKGHIIFASSQNRTNYYQRIHSWTNDPFTKLYSAPVYIDGHVGEAKPFAKKMEGKFNESTPVFSSDGQTMYFSSNTREDKKNKDDVVFVNLYKARLVNGKWSNVEKLSINVPNASSAHPALSVDEKWLYFVSDRGDSYGQSDIYRVEILSNGNFATPENLGDQLNTEGREVFPFISADNILYFASDGHPGLGGLDIFGVKIHEDGSLGDVVNLGDSVNSSYDDFAFYLDPNCKYGYMTSNRPGGKGKDDLYFVREIDGIELEFYQSIKGKVYDIVSGEILKEAKVSLYDQNNELVETVVTNENGEYVFNDKRCSISYSVGVDKEFYNTVELGLPALNRKNEAVLDFGLQGGEVKPKEKVQGIQIGDDLFKVLNLKPIYFDFGKADIRVDAESELYRVLEVLNLYPNMKIDVRSHTDVVGKDSYNLKLSQRRADSTVNWLISKGISRGRLTSKGFGSTRLINECSKGVPCSADKHQENRRSEFIVEDL